MYLLCDIYMMYIAHYASINTKGAYTYYYSSIGAMLEFPSSCRVIYFGGFPRAAHIGGKDCMADRSNNK